MSLSPSFNALYRQSGYAPYESKLYGSDRQNRQEIFTVASVAFAMKHDEQFRRTFLHKVCDVEETSLELEFDVELQPEHHADLRITCHSMQAVFIVEFKLGAELRNKQNPSKPEFFNDRKGYGTIMRNHADYKQFLHLTYVVLQKDAEFSDADLDGGRFRIRARRWVDLISPPSGESPLVCDLLDTLGGWGMSSLKFRKKTGMKKASSTQDAADIFQVVSAVAEDIGMNSKKFDWDVQSGSDNGAHFGLNIPAKTKGFAHLSELAGSTGGVFGWFGYGSGGDKEPFLSVWIYCKESKAVKSPASKVLHFVEKNLKGECVPELSDGHVVIKIGGAEVKDDKEWFSSILGALRKE